MNLLALGAGVGLVLAAFMQLPPQPHRSLVGFAVCWAITLLSAWLWGRKSGGNGSSVAVAVATAIAEVQVAAEGGQAHSQVQLVFPGVTGSVSAGRASEAAAPAPPLHAPDGRRLDPVWEHPVLPAVQDIPPTRAVAAREALTRWATPE